MSEEENKTIECLKKQIKKKDNIIATYKTLYTELQNDFENYKNDKDINYLDRNHHKQLVEKSIGQIIDKPEECWFDIFEVKVIKNNMLYGITINEDFINLKQIADKEWQLIGTMLGYA